VRHLQELFKYDHIRFAIHPVDSYASLQNNFREILEAQPEVCPAPDLPSACEVSRLADASGRPAVALAITRQQDN
jgi:hypothetical protein